jgi:2-keto-4-pentenoate hydratase
MKHRARRKPAKPRARKTAKATPATPPADAGAQAEAAAHFVRGVLTRGEAVPAGQDLPPGATHEIVQERPGSLPTIRRRRFSLR